MLMNKPKITYDDVIGLEEAKKSLNEAIVMPLMYPQLFFGMIFYLVNQLRYK